MSVRSTLIGTILIVFVLPFFIIKGMMLYGWGHGKWLEAKGYIVDTSPITLIERIVQQHGDPHDCLRFRYATPWAMGPTEGEQRASCIYQVAQKLSDPNICEMLMPSEYGLSCIAAVWGRIDNGRGCSSYSTGEVLCATITGQLSAKADTKNCNRYNREELRNWCHLERTRTLDVDECNQVTNMPPFKEECILISAFKEKDTSRCRKIVDVNRRAICEMRIAAWIKYPYLRSSSYFSSSAD